jgi:hypothetical protein
VIRVKILTIVVAGSSIAVGNLLGLNGSRASKASGKPEDGRDGRDTHFGE